VKIGHPTELAGLLVVVKILVPGVLSLVLDVLTPGVLLIVGLVEALSPGVSVTVSKPLIGVDFA